MDKSKRKGKPNRGRLLILVMMTIFFGCAFSATYFVYRFYSPRYFDAPVLANIEVSEEAVQARLLEYLILGESSCEDVDTFGQTYLDSEPSNCNNDTLSYRVWITRFPCAFWNGVIHFHFEDDILQSISFEEFPSCL